MVEQRPSYFVRRRDEIGTVINTICHTLEEALQKIEQLRSRGYSDVWAEGPDGRPVEETKLTAS